MTKLRVLDLFSGIGGFSLGLERTGGFETIAFCEIEPFCQKVLRKHWPDVPCHDDIETREFREGEADVITGGFPCQDISFAGAGAGLAGARSGLYRHIIRALRLVRPRYAVLENVAALLSRGLDTVLGDMAAVGYDAEWHCIPASAVGAPHRRDRVWILAHSNDQRCLGVGSRPEGDFRASQSGTWFGSALVANAQNDRSGRRQQQSESSEAAGYVAHSTGERRGEAREHRQRRSERPAGGSEVLADTVCERLQGGSLFGESQPAFGAFERQASAGSSGSGNAVGSWWSAEPDVGRVAHGVPSRMDRLRALGNAVVPQIPEMIGNAILQAEVA